MVNEVDISDLLVVDDRLSYGWREAEVEDGKLYIQFPDNAHSIVPENSRVEDNTWYLHVIVKEGGGAIIKDQYLEIPEGVERIVYDNIEYI